MNGVCSENLRTQRSELEDEKNSSNAYIVKKLDFDQISTGQDSVPEDLLEFIDRENNPTQVASELLGQLDEIQACMISLADIESRQATNAKILVKTDILASSDLPLILKRVVDICQPPNSRTNDILSASLRGLSSFVNSATDTSILKGIITSELTLWLKSLIKLPDYSPYVYESAVDGVVSLTENLLFSHYPKMKEEGLFALYSRYPVIYMSSEDARVYSTSILSKLHLPKTVIRVVPYSFSSPNSKTLDIRALDRLVVDDVACGKLPLLVLTTVGTEVTGHIDNIPAIKHICDKHRIWLHAKGSCSPLLAIPSPPSTVAVFAKCDSVTVECVTVTSHSLTTGLLFINNESDTMSHQPKLDTSLPLWVTLQKLGADSIRQRVSDSYDIAVKLYARLKEIQNIQLLEYPLTGHVVCFRYYSLLDNLPNLSDQEPMDALMSKFTELMFKEIEQAIGPQKITLITLAGGLSVIRVTPLEIPTLINSDLDTMLSAVSAQVALFETTLALRDSFTKEVQARDNFLVVQDPLHTSLGAFQYIPKYLQDEEACNTPEGMEELNEVNEKICDYLSCSWGELITIRPLAQFSVISVPLISAPIDVSSLLDAVVNAAPKFEDNSKYMARIAEMIKRGIEKANEELQQESELQMYEKGIIRQIPIFGSVFNWMSPIEDKKIVGRSFNLQSGEVQPSGSVFNSIAVTPDRSRHSSFSTHDPLS